MRRVYHPPKVGGSWHLTLLLGLVLTVGVFLLVPLTQIVSSGHQKKLLAVKDVAAIPPPPPAVVEPPPPEEKNEEEPPPPPDAPVPQQFSLSDLDLDLNVGTGGALGPMFNALDAAREALGGISIFDVADLDKPPQPLAQITPVYPPDLRKKRVEGAVTLVFVVDETGRVEDPRVENSSHPEFEKPALDALRRWKFKPGLKEGNPVKTHMRLPMRFSIRS